MKKTVYILLTCFMFLVGTSTHSISASSPITYDLNVVSNIGSNNDIKYKISNVKINASSVGYKSLTIKLPSEFKANYTLPTSWEVITSENIINFNTATTGSVSNIVDFLENNFNMTISTENVFPSKSVKMTINVSENLLSSMVDSNGKVHYYEFVPYGGGTKLTWLEAYNASKTRTFNGLKGYLTTITSQVEQDFIYESIAKTSGWLGGTRLVNTLTNKINDESSISTDPFYYASANDWYWANGPEAGTVFLQGTRYPNVTPVEGQFNYWKTDEPNNFGNNESALIFAFEGPRWNDGIYSSFQLNGYYVEYGGYSNEQPTQNNAGYEVAMPAPVKFEYLDVANNLLFTTTYLFEILETITLHQLHQWVFLI